jgi:hypothetical protein
MKSNKTIFIILLFFAVSIVLVINYNQKVFSRSTSNRNEEVNKVKKLIEWQCLAGEISCYDWVPDMQHLHEGVTALVKLEQEYPQDAEIHYMLGTTLSFSEGTYNNLNRTPTKEEMCKELKIADSLSKSYKYLQNYIISCGTPEDRLNLWRKEVQAKPDDPTKHYALASEYCLQNFTQECFQEAKKIVALAKGNTEWQYRAGKLICEQQGAIRECKDEGVKLMKPYVMANPDAREGAVVMNFISVLMGLNQTQDAISILEESSEKLKNIDANESNNFAEKAQRLKEHKPIW